MDRKSVKLDADLYDRLSVISKRTSLRRTWILNAAVREWIAHHEKCSDLESGLDAVIAQAQTTVSYAEALKNTIPKKS